MSALLARKCCCDVPSPTCDGTAWADAPSQVQVAITMTWRARTCSEASYDAGTGCIPAGFPPITESWINDQTVNHLLVGVLHKGPQSAWPGTMYVGNMPWVVPQSDSSAPLSWSTSVSGSGQRAVPVTVTVPGSPPFQCLQLVESSPSHSDGGTLYPRVVLGCVSGYSSSCATIPISQVRPKLSIGTWADDDLSEDANSSPQWPLNVVLPGQTSIYPPSNVLDPREIAWPPIIPACPPGNACDGCTTNLVSGVFNTCWSCRTTCVPRVFAGTNSFLSPIGHATEWVADGASVYGQYRLGAIRGGLCSDCGGQTEMPDCDNPRGEQWCQWTHPFGNGQSATRGLAYGTGTISA